ncbi:MAG: DUF4041 domain-containing protein, partial [Gulosibacter sp.]|uniref:DUF4041 domain-containing protein n=1 Tax=Gulosibacter sp. TaxID=2817531 RepID=UPI003F90E0A4
LKPLRAKVAEELVAIRDFPHPAEDSISLSTQLRDLRTAIKESAKSGAIAEPRSVTLPGTKAGISKLGRDLSKLALRAFNAECESIIRGATVANYESSSSKIARSADTINRLIETLGYQIKSSYIEQRIRELHIASKHLDTKKLERELERERKAELREQAAAERELQAERDRLEKEKAHYLNVLKVVEATGDEEEISKLRNELANIERGINDVEERAANIRAGYVYVISNVGSFGDRMVKIGMTRRLDPLDRVRELSDASVPFNFDVHAIFFSDDAVSVEASLHKRFADRRANLINTRREFFLVPANEVRDALQEINGNIMEFTEEPDAEQYRQTLALRTAEHQPVTELI